MKRKLHLILVLLLLTAAASLRARAAAGTNADVTLDARYFQLISQRNIFDPSRRPLVQRAAPVPRTPPADYFVLDGVASYDNKPTAFFEGSNRAYTREFAPAETIAGFKILQIANDYVELQSGTNSKPFRLRVQGQMRKPYGGSWALTAGSEPPAAPAEPVAAAASDDADATPADATPAAVGAAVDDVMKRLMERRAQEQGAQ